MKRKLLLGGIFFLLALIVRIGQLALNWTSESVVVKITYAAHVKSPQEIIWEQIKQLEKYKNCLNKLPYEKCREVEKALKKALGREDFRDLFDRDRERKTDEILRILNGELLKLQKKLAEPQNNLLNLRIPKIDPIDMQVLLGYRGLYKGELDGKSGPETWWAISEFQREKGIPVNGMMDARTEAALEAEYGNLLEQFGKIGFEASTLRATIERYRSYLGLEKMSSGSHFQEVSDYVERDLKCYEDVIAVYRGDPAPECIRAHEITWDLEKNGQVAHALVMGVDGIWEDWIVTPSAKKPRSMVSRSWENVTIQRTRGIEAIDWWDARSTEKVKANSDEVTAFFRMRASRTETDRVDFQIGEEFIKVSKSEIDNFIAGTGDFPKLDAFLKERSSLKQLVSWDPLDINTDRLRMVEAIESQYGDRIKVLHDDDLQIGKENAKNLPTIRGSTDLAAYIPRNGFDVRDYSVLQAIEDYLTQAQIRTIRDTTRVEESNIIIITGHKDKALKEYFMQLGREGCLKGKVVLMLSCYEQGDTAFHSNAIKGYGIRGITFLRETINPQAVEKVVVEMCDVLKKMQGSATDLKNLMKKSCRAGRRKE